MLDEEAPAADAAAAEGDAKEEEQVAKDAKEFKEAEFGLAPNEVGLCTCSCLAYFRPEPSIIPAASQG